MKKLSFLLVASFLLSSCIAHHFNQPVCKCECKCPNEDKKEEKKNKKSQSKEENFLTDDTTIQDVLGR